MSNMVELEEAVLEAEQNTQEGKFLTFKMGTEEYGIEIKHVTEIIGIQKITDLPDMPVYVKGIINLRGKVIPVIDIRLRFNLPERQYDERTCIIVVNLKGVTVGLIVDSVSEVQDIPDDSIELPPRVTRGSGNRYIQGLGKVGDNVKIILNIQRLLFEDELDELAEAIG